MTAETKAAEVVLGLMAKPTLGVLADMACQTETSLRVFLRTPHGDMPGYQLTATQTDDLSAYIRSLRSR